jgi:hypothetical protein
MNLINKLVTEWTDLYEYAKFSHNGGTAFEGEMSEKFRQAMKDLYDYLTPAGKQKTFLSCTSDEVMLYGMLREYAAIAWVNTYDEGVDNLFSASGRAAGCLSYAFLCSDDENYNEYCRLESGKMKSAAYNSETERTFDVVYDFESGDLKEFTEHYDEICC